MVERKWSIEKETKSSPAQLLNENIETTKATAEKINAILKKCKKIFIYITIFK